MLKLFHSLDGLSDHHLRNHKEWCCFFLYSSAVLGKQFAILCCLTLWIAFFCKCVFFPPCLSFALSFFKSLCLIQPHTNARTHRSTHNGPAFEAVLFGHKNSSKGSNNSNSQKTFCINIFSPKRMRMRNSSSRCSPSEDSDGTHDDERT